MKFNKWIVLILLNLLCFSANSQSLSFPVTGTFNVQDEANSRQKDFNKVKIEAGTFSLWMNDQVVRSYKPISEIKGGFSVEQIVPTDTYVYKETFNVTIDQISGNECFFTVHYEEGSETIHLVRQQ